MKLVSMLVWLLSATLFGRQKTPPDLNNSLITIRLKNGEIYSFSGDDYKVIKNDAPCNSPGIPTPTYRKSDFSARQITPRLALNKNRVQLHLGMNNNGLAIASQYREDGRKEYLITRSNYIVYGASYARLITSSISVSGMVSGAPGANSDFYLGLGWDW